MFSLEGVPESGCSLAPALVEGADVFVHNRDEKQTQELCSVFGSSVISEKDIAKHEYDIIVNATPIGMKPNVDAMPIPADLIRPGVTVFDLVYSPLETKLLREAKAKGAKAISGLVMFLAQGLEQERLWLGREIESTPYAKLLEKHVRERGD